MTCSWRYHRHDLIDEILKCNIGVNFLTYLNDLRAQQRRPSNFIVPIAEMFIQKKFPMKHYLLHCSVYSQAFHAFALNTEKYLHLRRSKDATRVPSQLGLTIFLTAINKLKTLRLTFLCFTVIFLSLSALRFLWSQDNKSLIGKVVNQIPSTKKKIKIKIND